VSCLLICIRSTDSPYPPICLLDMFDLELQKLHYQSRYLSRCIPPSAHCQVQLAKPRFALINAHHWSSSSYSYPVLWYNRHILGSRQSAPITVHHGAHRHPLQGHPAFLPTMDRQLSSYWSRVCGHTHSRSRDHVASS
jgi:hypothetical protein